MNSPAFYPLDRISVVDVTGTDAAIIVNNLTTNEVTPLKVGEGRETFVTDVRGKAIGHLFLYRVGSGKSDLIRLIGPAGQSKQIVEHVDRYTIREDAAGIIRDNEFCGIVLCSSAAELILGCQMEGCQTGDSTIVQSTCQIGEVDVTAYQTTWLGKGTAIVLVPAEEEATVSRTLQDLEISKGTMDDFHSRRVEVGFPWYGIDIDQSNLPQELDRDAEAISFTKGCYLGQETIARLDALGQVQRKLVRWSIQGAIPNCGETLSDHEKVVGRLTSIASLPSGETIALGFARRTHFEPGATAKGGDSSSGTEFIGTVIE